ncbi:hypothetical protein J4732_08965 [Serratia marcescens]|uniref:Uncharacterized protein n=1 Tax=Serratia marcescens TaxID=615 RepID=A0A939NLX0_SERMA|nr:hypothetical protein [Serratia marcescens]
MHGTRGLSAGAGTLPLDWETLPARFIRWRGEHVFVDAYFCRSAVYLAGAGNTRSTGLRSAISSVYLAGAGNTLPGVDLCRAHHGFIRWRGEHHADRTRGRAPRRFISLAGEHTRSLY